MAAIVEALAEHQSQQNWDVAVACTPGSDLSRDLQDLNIPVMAWEASRSPGLSLGREIYTLARVIRRVQPDVIHLHSSKAGLVGRLVVHGTRPTVFQPHAWSYFAVAGVTQRLAILWERFALRWTTLLVAVSEAELESGFAAGIRPRRWMVVANGVDVARFGKSDRLTARGALELPSTPLVVCLGRLCQQKGQDLLLPAWPAIVEAVSDARLVFVGDGPARSQLQSSSVPGVEFVGHSTTPEMWYAAADVVIVPSRWEGMPLVPLEAMASARSVVAFDVDGVAEAVDDAGAVVPAGDVQALITATIDRLRDPETAAREGLAGQARVSRLFTIDACTRRLSEAAMALVDDAARAPS